MSKKLPRKTLTFLIVGILILCLILFFRQIQEFLIELIAAFQNIETAREYIAGYGLFAPLISATLMIFQSVIAPLPAFLITIANGALFGFWWGMLLSWSSAMLGAALCFYIARFLGAKHVAKIVSQPVVNKTDQFIQRYGNYAILIARLIPYIPFDVVSYAAGLTRIRFLGFWLATGLGQLPATAAYTYLGNKISAYTNLMLLGFGVVISISIVIWLVKGRKITD
ncbi:MAG: TVP38/TMEM64 family protein [Candidatus Poribacteria bacterium]|nr:TVP38/TMEM64 family protein [Candidatus Poribacteria bacterium]